MNDQQKKEQSSAVRDQEIRAALGQHWAASDANDFETEHRIYHEDAVLEYPQSRSEEHTSELHDAHGVGRLAVICQDEFGDPKITAADDSSDSKPLFARLTSTLVLYVASTAGSLA